MEHCLFCRIAAGTLPTELIYQDEQVIGFRDLHPQAPVHCLFIPRQHITTLNDLTPETDVIMRHLFRGARQIAVQEGIAEDGYRTVINCNVSGGQSVYHLHLHLLGGRSLHWPPG